MSLLLRHLARYGVSCFENSFCSLISWIESLVSRGGDWDSASGSGCDCDILGLVWFCW